MKILALELSTARGGIAWEEGLARAAATERDGAWTVQEGNVNFVREWRSDRKNSATFFENLARVQRKFGLPETIIVGIGPGSYAGARIAISAAIGFQVASKARLIGFPSICAMECEANEYYVLGDARRKSFFFARVRANNLVEGPDLFDETELKSKLGKLGGTLPILASESLPQFECVEIRYPSALALARLARDTRRSFSLPPLEPIYLREPHVTIPSTVTTAS